MRARRRAVLLLALLPVLPLASCASGSKQKYDGNPEAVRVTWRDYRRGNRLELVSESHTSKVAQYSEKRDDAARKVQRDVFMQGLVEFLQLEGYMARASAGRAPVDGREIWTSSLEVDRDGALTHMAVSTGSPAEERIVFQNCVKGFLELYNATQAFQTVENAEGTYEFESPNEPGKPADGR